MPVPFAIHYGKVGKIYIEVPVINIASAPIKIEISDVCIFIKPKHVNDWKHQVEVDTFIKNTISSLEKYETYLQEKAMLESKDPGMMS